MIKGLPKVLVVDDEQDILELIRHSLSKEGFEVHVAANGAQAIEQAKKVKPEIIIMDVMMPIMDGMEACRQLKEIPETKNIPVIFLTARSEEFAELAGFEAGADDYIAKPVNLGELQAALERWGAADPLHFTEAADEAGKRERDQRDVQVRVRDRDRDHPGDPVEREDAVPAADGHETRCRFRPIFLDPGRDKRLVGRPCGGRRIMVDGEHAQRCVAHVGEFIIRCQVSRSDEFHACLAQSEVVVGLHDLGGLRSCGNEGKENLRLGILGSLDEGHEVGIGERHT